MGSTMVPLDRKLVSSHRLSIQITRIWYRLAAIFDASFYYWGFRLPV